MKKLLLLTFISAATMSFAQTSPINFEPDGNGADFSWATFEAPPGFENPTFTVEANPETSGINESATVAKIDIAYGTEDSWGKAGCETDIQGNNMGIFSFDESNSTVRVMILQVGFAAPVALKFANPTFGAEFETIVQNDVADEWVEIEFDMSNLIGSGVAPFSQFIFFPSYAPRETGHVVYFDNVRFGDPLSVSDQELDGFSAYPNPSKDFWTINSENSPIQSVVLMNILGQNVWSSSFNDMTVRIDTEALNTGLYIAQVKTPLGTRTLKLIKE